MNRYTEQTNFVRQINGSKVKILRKEAKPSMSEVRPNRLGLDQIKSLIPPFNPKSTTGLSAKQWIEKIENIRMLHDWDDRVTLLYATLRLEDSAKQWFNENLCPWEVFKVKLIKAFPHPLDEDKVFAQLMCRRKEVDESFENYAHDVEVMAKKCKFNLETTINYIITGLGDGSMRDHLIACDCKSISELLARMKLYIGIQSQQDLRSRLDRSKKHQLNQSKVVCYKCKKPGHVMKECREHGKHKHNSKKESSEEPPRKISCLDSTNDDYSDLVQTVKVDDTYMTAFVNLASDCTTLRLSEFEKYGWKMEECETRLRGFGQRSPMAIGSVTKNVTAGEVEMLTNIHIVKDSLQEFPMVLGRNFLHNPRVCVIKKFRGLEIKYVNEIIEEVKNENSHEMEEEEVLELLDFIERDCL